MTGPLNICVVGAGSSYTPEIVQGLCDHTDSLNVASLSLTDIDAGRLDVMAGLARRMLAHARCDIDVRSSLDRDAMLDGVDFVITQIRVGGMDARHLDESIPPKYGIVGQETTGPGGMFKALRTIPQMLEIARAVEGICPDAFILNYTNPSGIITEAVTRHSSAKFVGMCSGMPGIQAHVQQHFADAWPDLKTYCVGLNHLGFVYRFVSGGADVTAEAMGRLIAHETENGRDEWAAVLRRFGAMPIAYVNYYLRPPQFDPAAQTRAQQIMAIEAEVFAEAADPETVEKPQALQRRGGGGYAGVTFAVMQAITDDTGDEITVSAVNGTAVDGIEPSACVELTCRVGARGLEPIPVGEMPTSFRGLVQQVKAYETLTVDAAVARSRKKAIEALATHPLCDDRDTAEKIVDEMLTAHGLNFS